MGYRDIAWMAKYAPDYETGHHYLNEQRPNEQFSVEINWSRMTVQVREFDGTTWHVVGILPLNATSPADPRS